jgi:hypothetical protein
MAILAECPICHGKHSLKRKKCGCGHDMARARKNRKAAYWIDYRLPGGKQKREAVGSMEGLNGYSKTDAKAAMAKRRTQVK